MLSTTKLTAKEIAGLTNVSVDFEEHVEGCFVQKQATFYTSYNHVHAVVVRIIFWLLGYKIYA